MATTTAAALSLKLFIDPKSQRVLFSEAGVEVVDFLFSLLPLPFATIVILVGKDAMVGSVGNLYASVEKLDAARLLPGSADALLRPSVGWPGVSGLLLPTSTEEKTKTLYGCAKCRSSSSCRIFVPDVYNKACRTCGSPMAKGFVEDMFAVTDNLTITPLSSASSMAMTDAWGMRIGDLQVKTVLLGHNEALEILKAALHSKTVLSDVFLGNKAPDGA